MGGDRLVISLGYAVYTSPSHPVFLKGSACSPNWAPRVSEAFAFGVLIFVHMGGRRSAKMPVRQTPVLTAAAFSLLQAAGGRPYRGLGE